ncbi:MAG: response regulator [Anaerolineales bacterium]
MTKSRIARILLAGLDHKTAQQITQELSTPNLIFDHEWHRFDVLHALELYKYDLIILDEHPDHLSCFRTCAEIRDDLRMNDVPILVLTQEMSQTTVAAFEEIDVNLFIEKPVTHKELITVSRIIVSLSSSSL